MKRTQTSASGVGRREGHDSSQYYARRINAQPSPPCKAERATGMPVVGEWTNRIYNESSERMTIIPDDSIGLAFTSPPYAVGKEYDLDYSLEEYLALIENVSKEVYRVLVSGGRYVVNVANLGRKPYLPLTSYFYRTLTPIGFLPVGEIIWQKAKGAGGSCAWGSWRSAKAPRLRDLHEYLLVFAKEKFARPDKGISTIDADAFLRDTLSVWNVRPESAKRIGHPAPFPVELASRVINLLSYQGDVVLDPFAGSGSTLLAARKAGRLYVGYDTDPSYCTLAQRRLDEES